MHNVSKLYKQVKSGSRKHTENQEEGKLNRIYNGIA